MSNFTVNGVYSYTSANIYSYLGRTPVNSTSLERAFDDFNITPTGIWAVDVFSLIENNQGLKSTNAPLEIDFAESITEPPPTAKIKSILFSLQSLTPSNTKDNLGFGSTPPNSIKSILFSFNLETTKSYKPFFFIEDLP